MPKQRNRSKNARTHMVEVKLRPHNKSLNIDPKTGFDVTHTVVVVSDTMLKKHVDLVANCARAWNNIPQWRRKNVRKIHLACLSRVCGFYDPRADIICIDPVKADETFDDVSWVFEHEIGHLNFSRYTLSMIRKWIKGSRLLNPITSITSARRSGNIYNDALIEHIESCKILIDLSRKKTLSKAERVLYEVLEISFNNAINSTRGGRNGSAVDIAYREYITCLDFYSNEQHSEFLAIYYGKCDSKYDKDVYKKLEKLYKSMHDAGRKY